MQQIHAYLFGGLYDFAGKIRLGDMGDFSVSLTSKGTETADKFTSQNITDVRVVWEPASEAVLSALGYNVA